TLEAGMDEPEQKWPSTNLTPFDTIWLATATACFGSQASSPTLSASCWPRTPPAALMSFTAISAPRFICSPKLAYCPVIGPTVATWISSAQAVEAARAIEKPMARPDNVYLFVWLCRGVIERCWSFRGLCAPLWAHLCPQ